MFRKGTNTVVLVIFVLAIIFTSMSCEKLKISRLKANNHFNRANKLFSDGKYRGAIEEYEIALIHNPNLVEAFRFLGESYKNLYKPGVDTPENMEKANKALDALAKAYEIDPNNKDIIYSLGDMHDRLRNFEEAEKLHLRIIEMEPTNMNNYYIVAGFYSRYATVKISGESVDAVESEGGRTPFQKAEEMYLRRIELDPENPEGYAYMAQFYGDLPVPDFDKAREFHEYRIKYDPANAIAWLSIGRNRWAKAHRLQNVMSKEEQLKLADESFEALQKAIKLDPSYPEPYAYMSVLNRSLRARLEPEKASRLNSEADQYIQKFQEARKKRAERKKLEQELRGKK